MAVLTKNVTIQPNDWTNLSAALGIASGEKWEVECPGEVGCEFAVTDDNNAPPASLHGQRIARSPFSGQTGGLLFTAEGSNVIWARPVPGEEAVVVGIKAPAA